MIQNSIWSWWLEISSKKEQVTIALLTLSIITFLISWYKSTSPLPPGPRGLPVVGYLPFLGFNLHHEFTKLAQLYGPIFKLKLGSKTHVVVSSPDLAKVVVREQDDVFANRDPPVAGLAVTYGQGIVWANNNAQWRNMRKVFVYEVLSSKNLEASGTFRRVEVRKTVKRLYGTVGAEVDIGEITFLTSLNVVMSMMWGKSVVDDGKCNGLGVDFREVITKIVELLGTANVSDLFPAVARLDLQVNGIKEPNRAQDRLRLSSVLLSS